MADPNQVIAVWDQFATFEQAQAYSGGGLQVQVSAEIARSPGVTPDVGRLVWKSVHTQPTDYLGTLIFLEVDPSDNSPAGGDTVIVFDAILDDPQESRGNTTDIVYKVKDRRWRWETPTVFGHYNLRDQFDEIKTGTALNAQEAATLCLKALGEDDYDVSVLPTDADLMPALHWHYTSAAVELQKICRLFGCDVHLLADNSVAILLDGTGTVPSGTDLEVTPASGLLIEPTPPYITAYANDTLFDAWLFCGENVCQDVDGKWKHVDRLTYRPDDGWLQYTQGVDIRSVMRKKLAPTFLTDQQKENVCALYERHVFRSYRVNSFIPDETVNWLIDQGSMDSENGPSGGDDAGMPTPSDFGFYGNSTSNWHVIEWDAVNGEYFLINSHQYYTDALAEMLSADNDRWSIAAPGQITFDPLQVCPLEDRRLVSGKDVFGEYQRLGAEVLGRFDTVDEQMMGAWGSKASAIVKQEWRMWPLGFSINRERGIVTLNRKAYRHVTQTGAGSDTGPSVDSSGNWVQGATQADILLRTGFRLRRKRYGSVYHHHHNLSTGSSLQIANAVVPRRDLQKYVIRRYSDDYNEPSPSGVDSNETEVDLALKKTATEYAKRYIIGESPQQRVYRRLRSINTNGVTKQVKWSCGHMRRVQTVVSIGFETDRATPPAELRRRNELEADRAKEASERFADDPPPFFGDVTYF